MLKTAKKPVILSGKTVNSELEVLRALHDLRRALGEQAVQLSIKGKANSLSAAQYGLEQAFAPAGYAVVYAALGDEKPSQRLLDRLTDQQVPGRPGQLSVSPLTEMADVVLPVTDWVEQSGHFVNTGWTPAGIHEDHPATG